MTKLSDENHGRAKAGRRRQSSGSFQFGLPELLELTAICAVVAACGRITEVPASVALMLFALAVWTRQGFPALVLLIAASVAADLPADSMHRGDSMHGGVSLARQLAVFGLATGIAGWYAARRQSRCSHREQYERQQSGGSLRERYERRFRRTIDEPQRSACR